MAGGVVSCTVTLKVALPMLPGKSVAEQVPGWKTMSAKQRPVVILTSNRVRELSDEDLIAAFAVVEHDAEVVLVRAGPTGVTVRAVAEEGDRVWLVRGCPEHGRITTLYDERPDILHVHSIKTGVGLPEFREAHRLGRARAGRARAKHRCKPDAAETVNCMTARRDAVGSRVRRRNS